MQLHVILYTVKQKPVLEFQYLYSDFTQDGLKIFIFAKISSVIF